jgi:putative hemolysin
MKSSSLLLPIPMLAAFYMEEFGGLRTSLAPLYTDSGFAGMPKAYALVFLLNIIVAGFTIVVLGFKVGAARKKYREKAMKEDEKDAEARFSYPNLYVEGNTENAKMFNCAQRGHQQAFETYTQVKMLNVCNICHNKLIGEEYFSK